jgi:hypothetical protein
MNPTDCPIFATCNAAVCPLDPAWRKAVHLPGEPVCRYLLAGGKAGAVDHYRDDPAFAAVSPLAGAVSAEHPDIAKKVARAARSGFPGQHLRRRALPVVPPNPAAVA